MYMDKYFYVILWFFLGFTVTFSFNASADAAQLPVLKAGSKTRPTLTPRELRSAPDHIATTRHRSAPKTLGAYNSIGQVKSSIGKNVVGKRSARVPRASRISKQISSKSVMIMDANTGETIFAKAPDAARQPASTIKIITGMIAIKSLTNTDLVSVSKKASQMPRSKIYLDPKKQYIADDIINAVLLASANDASVAVAEQIAGNEKAFAKMMTMRARLWGAKRTICQTASGLTAKGQQSTARDLATIFRHVMKDNEFARRMKKRKTTTSYGKALYNHNKALWQVNGAQGGKTGYTAAARQTYVGQFSRDGETIVVALMGSETMWSDVKRLVDYGFKRKKQIQLAKNEAAEHDSTQIN